MTALTYRVQSSSLSSISISSSSSSIGASSSSSSLPRFNPWPAAGWLGFEPGTPLKTDCCRAVPLTPPASAESPYSVSGTGILKVPSSFAIKSDLVFAYAIFYANKRDANRETQETNHWLPEKHESFQLPHGLGGSRDILEDNVRLSAHLHRLLRHDVQDRAIGGK